MRKQFSLSFISHVNIGNTLSNHQIPKHGIRCASNSLASSYEGRARRNFLFSQEQKRQSERVGRVEKIQVEYKGTPDDVTLVMNKNISTPYNCAQHMSEMLMNRSALALINGTTMWDMHRPLDSDCQLELLHFQEADPYSVNKAFWRTCSLILGAVAETCFKPEVNITLHSFPSPNVRTGSFVYDVEIGLENWSPSKDELRIISSEMVKICRRDLKLERLSVPAELAQDMFQNNVHKSEQLPDIVSQSPEQQVTLYRLGEHIDISRGPMIGDTSFVGRCTIASVHHIPTSQLNLYRFQGVALPKGFLLNHFAWGILEKQATKLNPGRLPTGTSVPRSHPAAESLAG